MDGRSLTEKQAHHGTGNEPTKGGRCTYIFCTATAPTVDWCDAARVTIDMLPDVTLLEIFHFYVGGEQIGYVDEEQIEVWHTLVHVCRKWRIVVFGSPRRLALRLRCTPKTPVRETLDVWPLLPIVMRVRRVKVMDNIIAAFKHNDRICELELWHVPSSQMEHVFAAMQQPFPALTRLWLRAKGETVPIIPASFLGGSAPRLQKLWLNYVSFPELPKLLLSATRLVRVDLWNIPHLGYISPEAVITSLSGLTRLEKLGIGFESPRSRPDQKSRRPLPQTRTLLPVLTKLEFQGVSEYLEVLVARIDAPLLSSLETTFFHQLIFDTPQLTQFPSRTPKFKGLDEARVVFSHWQVLVILPRTIDGALQLAISCSQPDWQLSSLAQICSSSFPLALISAVEHLYIQSRFRKMHWQDDIESSQWLELLHPFTAVTDLYLSQESVSCIAPVLQELVRERVTEVLPALQTLFLEEKLPSGPIQDAIGQFVAERQLPITISHWE
jgi:hypothetical protein